MRIFSLLLFVSTVVGSRPGQAGSIPTEHDLRVVPLPSHYTVGQGAPLCLSPDFEIKFDKSFKHSHIPKDLLRAVKEVEERLWASKHEYLSVERGSELLGSAGCAHHLKMLEVMIDTKEQDARANPIDSIMHSATRRAEDRAELERYFLSVPLSGPAVLRAPTALGAFRGLTTFESLFYYLPGGRGHKSNAEMVLEEAEQLAFGSRWLDTVSDVLSQGHKRDGIRYAPLAPYEIEDKPAFGWRAVMLDTSRNYFTQKAILKVSRTSHDGDSRFVLRLTAKMLDSMASVKLNVFHWHITDSNSWPLDLGSHPELAKSGAYGHDQRYTDSDIKHIIRYAGERGIDTVLEIDTPGHTASIAESHPDLVACFERDPWQTYSGQPPAGQLRFASQSAVDFTRAIFESTLDLVSGQYFGTGGDEVNDACMLEDEETAAALREHGWTLDDALNDYTAKTHATILDREKTPVVWQEMVLDHGELRNLSKDAIVDIWINSEDARKVLGKGFKIIHASSDYFYLGHGMGEWVGRPEGKKNEHNFGNPFKSWQRMYSFDPYDNVEDGQRAQVLGGQASLWAEQTDETNFESVMWPRAAAVAELFWTGSAGQEGYPRNPVEALPRMHDIRYRLVDRGVRAGPLQPHWCALRPGVCVDDL